MAFTVVDGPAPRPAGCWPFQTEWLAEYNRRSEYNESEIVEFVKEIFDHLVLFGYVQAGQIRWPPTGRHAINETLCNELHLDPSVVSLMKRLPYIVSDPYGRGDLDFSLSPASPQVSYLDDRQLREGREAHMGGPPFGRVESQDLKLTECMMYGTSIILDTKESK